MNETITKDRGGWADVDVSTPGGQEVRRAQVVGPFAVHQSKFGDGWVVTHLRTGRAVLAFFTDTAHRDAFSLGRYLRARLAAVAMDSTDPLAVGQLISPVARAWAKKNQFGLMLEPTGMNEAYRVGRCSDREG